MTIALLAFWAFDFMSNALFKTKFELSLCWRDRNAASTVGIVSLDKQWTNSKNKISTSEMPNRASIKMTPEEFITWITPVAQKICKRYNLFSSVCIAQAALESGWGKNRIGEYNLFGRKAVAGDKSITVETQECDNGVWKNVSVAFKDYDSLEEAIEDYCVLVTEELVYAPCLKQTTVKDFVTTLGPIYATDPQYANKIIQTIGVSELEQYDK